MTIWPELLKEADPLNGERRDADERRRRRDAIVNAPGGADGVPRRSALKAVLVAGALVAMGAGGLLWPRASIDVIAAVRFEVRLAEQAFAPGLHEVTVDGGRKIYLHDDTVVTNSDIAQAQLVQGADGRFGVSITFKTAGAGKMRRATQGHIDKPLAILIDGAVVMAPTVRSAIDTSALLSGDYTKAEAERIVAGIIGR